MANVIEHADGVWLNLPESDYFADPAIGSTALNVLRTSPCDFWWEGPYNELRPQKPKDDEATKAQLFGSATHCALLEGIDVFNYAYGIVPDKFTHPRALDTADQLKAWLKERGEKVSGSKPELVERILALDPAVEILDRIQEQAKASGKKSISRWDFNKITLMHRLLMGPKQADGSYKLTSLGKAFQGGLSEVSVFFTDENGIRQRARFDKVKPNVTIDLKTYSNWKSRDFDKAVLREFAMKNYHVQAAAYEEARHQLRRLVSEGKIFAPSSDDPELQSQIDRDIAMLHGIAKADKWKWVWVAYKTDGAPRAKGFVMDWRGEHKNIFDEGLHRRQEGLANFIQYREFYGWGPELPMWKDPEMLVEPPADWWPPWAQIVE